MGDSFGGFSIREYALKMRSEDVVKCWPFSSGNSDSAIAREVVESLLPPMSVSKFRWWSRELEIARSTRNDLDAPSSRCESDARGFVSTGSSSLGEPRASSGEPPRSEIITFDCPVCGVLTAATVNAVNAHVDSCLARQEEKRQAKAKAKSRAPKKRSIVEIFAMSPQVQRVSGSEDSAIAEDEEEDEEEEEEQEREDKSRQKATDAVNLRRKKVKKKKNTVWPRVSAVGKIHKKKKKKNKKNKKKKWRKISGNGSINKESSPKLTRKIASHLSRNVNCLCNEKNKNDMLDAASINKEKPSLKSLSSPKKHKAMEPCKSIAKRLKPEYPVRSILKKRARSYSGQESTVCNRQSSAHVNSQTALVEKHVRFLIKDDKSGTQAKSNLQASLQQPGRHAGYTDENPGQLVGRGGDLVQGIGAGDNLSDRGKDGSDDQAIAGKGQLPDTCHHTDIRSHVRPQASCQNILNLSEESNLPSQIARVSHEHFKMYGQTKLAVDDSPQNVDYCTFQEAVNGRAASCSNVSVASSAFRPENSGTEFMKCFLGTSHDFCGKKPMAMAVTRSSSSCFTIDGSLSGRLSMSSVSSVEDAADYAVLKQPLCSLPPRNLTGNLSHLPEWSERIVSLTGKPMDEDFLGLPLNSHGELIQWNSSGSMHTQVKKWDMIPGSSNFLPNESLIRSRNMGDYSSLKENRFVERAREDQLNLFPMENFSVENSRLSLLSNQGGMESQDTTRANIFWQSSERHSSPAYLLDADINQTNIPVNACRQYDLFENQKGKGVIYLKENADHVLPTATPVTMRLMGKDVAVGRSSRETHGSEDGKIWTDKQIIIEHQPSSSLKNSFSENNPFLRDWSAYSAPRKPKGALHPSFESQNAFHLRSPQKAPESVVSNPCIDWQSEVVLSDGKVSAQRNPYFEHRPFTHHPCSPLVFQLTDLPEPFMVGTETLRADSQLASRTVSHQSCQQMNRGPELKNLQSLPHPKISSPTIPFLSPDFREHKQIAQQWQSPSFHKELPPWFTFSHPVPDSGEPTPSQLKSFSKDLSLWRPILNASERGSAPCPQYQSFCDRGSIHHSYGTPTNNYFSTPHMHYPPVSSFPYNTMASQVDNPMVLSPIACPRPPFVPVLPRGKPTSAVSMSYRNGTDLGVGSRSNYFGAKIPGFCKKTKKRPAIGADDFRKDGKPKLKLPRHGVGLPISRENPSLKLDSNRERASSTVSLQDGIQKDGLVSLPGGQSFKLTEAAKSGPTKLSAGAKHILKPSKNVDDDNSIPIHSTIPFAGVTMVPESRVKSAKIYEF